MADYAANVAMNMATTSTWDDTPANSLPALTSYMANDVTEWEVSHRGMLRQETALARRRQSRVIE
ncbi:TPA: hypothetical protein N0F65_009325 [Lagenidium giganteum]|uniref:Uncharacterized protein n=1 Tax=Lagenidium giganteum TaxID=4803 RepID=A0AAV2YXJ4_9STRA|nr:TPA: hypothetical protein N0F65_009325 [Lagenidium giganteum]